jgi:enterochelin esterase-like enzyme
MLNAKLKLSLIKLQADRELGQSYAGLLALIEGLHSLKYLGDEDYLLFSKKYSKKLVVEDQKVQGMDQQAVRELESMTKLFKGVLADWSLPHNKGWKEGWVKRASNYASRIKAAQMIVELGKQEL